uniref:FTH domain-containing protein n=1 Tax=Steinernema glaseri TaxID=37863 RepID=A0A1I7Y8U8_9BILA
MDSVPYEFVKQTLLLVGPSESHCESWASCHSLSGHWGGLSMILDDETVQCSIVINCVSLSELNYIVGIDDTPDDNVTIEDLLAKKHINISFLGVIDDTAQLCGPKKIDKEQSKLLQRLLSRSNGNTRLHLKICLWKSPELDTILGAIPRVVEANPRNTANVAENPSILSLLTRHIQSGNLRKLNFSFEPVHRSFFPVIRQFFKEVKITYFRGCFVQEDEQFAKEVVSLISGKLKRKRMEYEREIFGLYNQEDDEDLPELWTMRFLSRLPFEIIFKDECIEKPNKRSSLVAVTADPPLFDQLEKELGLELEPAEIRYETLEHAPYAFTMVFFFSTSRHLPQKNAVKVSVKQKSQEADVKVKSEQKSKRELKQKKEPPVRPIKKVGSRCGCM